MSMIRIKDVWKTFHIYPHPVDRLREVISPFRKKYHAEFHALRELSFAIEPGECVGIIGVNGSGKSTLLQLIAGVLTPTAGVVETNGRVSALLELGAGFSPQFTGRENIALHCSLAGIHPRDQGPVLEQIISFAEIGDFIDRPIKTYSSGMYVRLAFSAAIHVDPQILIVDEALAVGDIRFQAKCLRRITAFREQGKTLLFVSHDASAVKALCDRAILLNKGRLLMDGTPDQVTKYYNNMVALEAENDAVLGTDLAKRGGNQKIQIRRVRMLNRHGDPTDTFQVGEAITLLIDIEAFADVPSPTVGMSFHDRMGVELFGINNHNLGIRFEDVKRGDRKTVQYDITLDLGINTYTVSASCHAGDNHLIESYDWVNDAFVFRVVPSEFHVFVGACRLDASVKIENSVQ